MGFYKNTTDLFCAGGVTVPWSFPLIGRWSFLRWTGHSGFYLGFFVGGGESILKKLLEPHGGEKKFF